MSKVISQNYNSKVKNDLKTRLYYFSVEIINYLVSSGQNRHNNPILDQLIRSATSIGANIVEAKSASSRKDFIKYYEIALKSSNESKYWLYLLRDTNFMNKNRDTIQKFIDENVEISKILASCILKLKGKV